MPAINVNPTRQELTRLKTRLKTSIRGHKLLKDKRDELMKQFMDVVRENRALRKKVEEGLMKAHGSFTVASALMSSEMLEQSLLYRPTRKHSFITRILCFVIVLKCASAFFIVSPVRRPLYR